jgi:hypothetical protein
MSDLPSLADLAVFERVLARTKLRLRCGRAARALLVGTALSATSRIYLHAAGSLSPGAGLVLTLVALAPACAAALWPVASERAASLLDGAHDSYERARSGVEFMRLSAARRTPFMQAHLRDLASRARTWSAARALPVRRPNESLLLLVPCAAWLLTMLTRPEDDRAARSPSLTAEKQAAISQDDLAAFRGELRQLSAGLPAALKSDEVRAFNELLERLATGGITRSEGIRALLSMERQLLSQADQAAVQESDRERLQELAQDLARASEALAQALRAGDTGSAAQELRALARRAMESNGVEREQLKKALANERARQRADEAKTAREQELEGLLRKPRDAAAQTPGERSLFERRKRELEQLRREHGERQTRSRQLERLSRDLAKAAEALDANATSDALRELEEAARDLERFAEQKRASNAAQDLAREASQLRELLQQQSSTPPQGQRQAQSESGSGSGREARQQRFVLKARGEGEQAKLSLRPGDGNGREGSSGTQGEGQPGQPEQSQSRDPTQGQSGQQIQVLAPGAGGGEGQQAELLVPSVSRSTPKGEAVGSQSMEGAGSERGASALAKPTSLKATHADSAVAGSHGKGPTRSQVILDAADRGFRTTPYQKVYADYRAHAESVIERDQVPPGHRFYVRRYFQLIRPRDE